MILQPAVLFKICPSLGDRVELWAEALNAGFEVAEINTPERIAGFMGQALLESGRLSVLRENLNYSAEALLRVFPTHFTPAEATAYAHQAVRIANHAYANRMGNGDEASGDGWRFRGGGIFQHTGRASYLALGEALTKDPTTFIDDPDGLTDPDFASMAAVLYWGERKLNTYADQGNIDAISDLINIGHLTARQGDANGFKERADLTAEVLTILKEQL